MNALSGFDATQLLLRRSELRHEINHGDHDEEVIEDFKRQCAVVQEELDKRVIGYAKTGRPAAQE